MPDSSGPGRKKSASREAKSKDILLGLLVGSLGRRAFAIDFAPHLFVTAAQLG
jgi:hypothetical protein